MTTQDLRRELKVRLAMRDEGLSDLARRLGWSRQLLHVRIRRVRPARQPEWLALMAAEVGMTADEILELAR